MSVLPSAQQQDALLQLVRNAGAAIMEVYARAEVLVENKQDQSPLTAADRASHTVLAAGLANWGYPILSEEGEHAGYENRRHWSTFWLIDPLDGTKEFLKRNGEFTVNVALVHEGSPVWGAVYAPVPDMLYWGGPSSGAFRRAGQAAVQSIAVSHVQQIRTMACSRSHLDEATRVFAAHFPEAALVPMGSSLKLMLVAEGKVDVYPRLGPTMEWDIAASQAIVEGAGGRVVAADSGLPLVYNKPNLLNPWFLADGRHPNAPDLRNLLPA